MIINSNDNQPWRELPGRSNQSFLDNIAPHHQSRWLEVVALGFRGGIRVLQPPKYTVVSVDRYLCLKWYLISLDNTQIWSGFFWNLVSINSANSSRLSKLSSLRTFISVDGMESVSYHSKISLNFSLKCPAGLTNSGRASISMDNMQFQQHVLLWLLGWPGCLELKALASDPNYSNILLWSSDTLLVTEERCTYFTRWTVDNLVLTIYVC